MFNSAVKSIVREHGWAPEIIGSLFFDRQDYKGLLYWYDDVIEINISLCTEKKDLDKMKMLYPWIDPSIFEAQERKINK